MILHAVPAHRSSRYLRLVNDCQDNARGPLPASDQGEAELRRGVAPGAGQHTTSVHRASDAWGLYRAGVRAAYPLDGRWSRAERRSNHSGALGWNSDSLPDEAKAGGRRPGGGAQAAGGRDADALPPKPGHLAKYDYEYKRGATASIFLFLDRHGGWRHARATEYKGNIDFAHCMRERVDVHYPTADVIRVVLDNLSTHRPGALYKAFPPAEALRSFGAWRSAIRPDMHAG